MTEPTQPRTYRTRAGLVLTDADIEHIAEEVERTDFDPTKAKVLYPAESPEPDRFVGLGGTRTRPRDFDAEVLALAREGPITNAAVRARTVLDRAAVLRVLNRLVANGRLERHGTKRGTHYTLRQHPPD